MRKILTAAFAVMMILNIALSAMATETVVPAAEAVVEGVSEQAENRSGATEPVEEDPDAYAETEQTAAEPEGTPETAAEAAVAQPEQPVEDPEAASQADPETTWYELTRDEMGADLLTVHLKSNITTGYNWMFDISDPEMLELLTQEYVEDDNAEGVVGAGGTWHASFRNFSGKTGRVTLALGYGRTWEEEPVELHVLEMEIGEAGQISVLAVDPGEDLQSFFNPDDYDMLHVTDVFRTDEDLVCVQAAFGTLGEAGELIGFDSENAFSLTLMPGCELMLPEDMENPVANVPFMEALDLWYAKANAVWGDGEASVSFYAGFSMNEAAEITHLSYIYLP